MPFFVTSCAFKIHRASGPSRRCAFLTRIIYACAQLIDGLGHATQSATVPVSRSRTQSFQQNRSLSFQAREVLQPLVSLIGRLVACSARIAADRRTHTQTKYRNPRCACAEG